MASCESMIVLNSPYIGDGCDVHPACLSCPLPRCRYDDPVGYQRWQREELDKPVGEMEQRGLSVKEIALQLGKNDRAIYRALERIRKRAGAVA